MGAFCYWISIELHASLQLVKHKRSTKWTCEATSFVSIKHFSTGLSNRIVFAAYRIEYFGSNRIESYADQIECFSSIFDSIRFDLEKILNTKKNQKVTVKSKKFTNSDNNWLCQLLLKSRWITLWRLANFTVAKCVSRLLRSFSIESNRYRIEIESNREVSALSESKIESNRKRFDLTALWVQHVKNHSTCLETKNVSELVRCNLRFSG
jgi:hypothetical protein